MLINTLFRTEHLIMKNILSRSFSSTSPWDILTGVCVERVPVVTPPLNDIQRRYKEFLDKLELEKSFKSDHELRFENDLAVAAMLKNEANEIDMDTVSKITAQDFEDAANEELTNFKFADVKTEADTRGDKTSVERSLQRHIVLVSEHTLGSDKKILFPQNLWKQGETLRQTAERILLEQCGPQLKVKFLGNAPCGFYKYKYPKEIEGKIGAKVFFYYASYISGNVTSKQKSKYQWLTRNELQDILPDRYNKSIQEFLIQENY